MSMKSGAPMATLPLASLALLLIVWCGEVSAGAQIDVGLGESRFFVGERFLITFKDVIYWVAGMCMGLIFATTFLFVNDFSGVMGMVQKTGKRGHAKGDLEETREARLIGSKKYPTHMEERILTAIHTEPDNYIPAEPHNRQGRLIGFNKLSTGMEDRMLERVDAQPDNSFVQEAVVSGEEEESEPSVVSKLFKILSLFPISDAEETSTLDINHFF